MIKHIFKLVWNRKRSNFLITVEIFFSFLILFSVIMLAVYFADNYNRPLGYDYENVWNISIDVKQETDDVWTPEQVETTRALINTVRDFPEVESVSGAHTAPYSLGNRTGGHRVNGVLIQYEVNEVTDSFKDVMKIKLTQGRWFGKEDDGVSWKPLVINQRLAESLYGSEDPIGKQFYPPEYKTDTRIIGIIEDFRKDGELSAPGYYVIERKDMSSPNNRPPRNILIKVRPGTVAAFEEQLIAKLQTVARDWSFEVDTLADMRQSSFNIRFALIATLGIIAGFLMIMVGLGLTGVLWQNVTQRTKEIGLRRAKGATVGDIYTQILGELLVITTFGLILGTAVIVQFPLLDLIGFISARVYLFSLIISQALIYMLTVICGLYPSRLAAKIHPAQALHYE
jgi:putative ABC transport system permease protein